MTRDDAGAGSTREARRIAVKSWFALALAASTLMALALAGQARAAAAVPPSHPAVDSPELARLGTFAVGLRTVRLVDRNAVDLVAPGGERVLRVDVWYPARLAPGAKAETYRAELQAEPPGAPVRFTMPGLAVRNAKPVGGRYPLVILSHGRSNATVALSWLTENLASKGYIVAAIRHEDLLRSNPLEFPEILLRRPLDIAFVARSLAASPALAGIVDASRTALIGYSMGGYGVLTVAGAALDPQGSPCKGVPGGLLLPYARSGAQRDSLRVANLRAVVAIAPWGGAAWGADGPAGISAPLLLIAGDRDHSVDYASGARAFFEAATGARRYLLTFHGAGHALAFGPAPEQMSHRVWDINWFEDPVWRKERIIGINLHTITAFLDRYAKDDVSRAAYLDGLVSESTAGSWKAPEGTSMDAFSPGGEGITLWKGFQRDYAEGLQLLQREAQAPASAVPAPASP
jgi:predicted dienelactone hydrolase